MAGTNVHMEHLEDNVINRGVEGARDSINFIRSLRDMLAGRTKNAMNITVKWDGAPAIFAGIDPSDGKFFIAKKGIFNKNPIVYKSLSDITSDGKLQADLSDKFQDAFKYLSALGIKGIIQGDFLYSRSDVKKETIDGTDYFTFHPNTIVYAVPVDSKMGKAIAASKIGIVWHTTYSGPSFDQLKASFGQDISPKLKTTKQVWHTDATFQDLSGRATMTEKETKAIDLQLSMAGKSFNRVDSAFLNTITSEAGVGQIVKQFMNTYVRDGKKMPRPAKMAEDLHSYANQWWQKQIDKVSLQTSKDKKAAQRDKQLQQLDKRKIVAVFELISHIVAAKLLLVNKLNQAAKLKTLLKTADGFKVTGEEGYVAIDHLGKNALKLVDRLEFSKANFSSEIIKGWQK